MKIDGQNPLLNTGLIDKSGDKSKVDQQSQNTSDPNTQSAQSSPMLKITETGKLIHQLSTEIDSIPSVDKQRIEAIRAKIANNQIGILGEGDTASKAADRIAKKLIEMDQLLSK